MGTTKIRWLPVLALVMLGAACEPAVGPAPPARRAAEGSAGSAAPPRLSRVSYPRGDCSTGRIEVEIHRSGVWIPHPEHPRVFAGDVHLEVTQGLLSELHGREIPPELRLHWTFLDDAVRFVGVRVGHVDQEGGKERRIFFDPLGRTSQKVIYLGHRNEKEVEYSVIVPPLTGTVEVVKGRAGFATATDGDF